VGALAPAILKELAELSQTAQPPKEQALAFVFGYSQRQFRRLCMGALGETASSLVLRLRLERAAGQLAGSDASIEAVANCAGFASREGFSRAFASHFGCAPAEFRSLNEGMELPLPGHVLATGGLIPASALVRTGQDTWSKFLFDGPILLGRVFSTGAIDWRSQIRKPGQKRDSARRGFA